MTLWRPHPRAMDDDAVLLLCGPEAQAVAYRLAARAVGGRVAVGEAPEAAVVAICGGAPWAVRGLGELIARGRVVPEEGALALAWEWPALVAAPPPSPSAATPHAPEEAPPRDADPRAAARRLYALLSRYGLKTTEARVAWVDSPAGARFLAREQRERVWAVDLASRVAGDNRGRFSCHRAATTHGDNSTDNRGDNHGDNSIPPPEPPTPENNQKSSGSSRAGAGDNHGDNSGDNSPPSSTRRQPSATTLGDGDNRPRCATVETLTAAPSAAEVLMHLRGAGRLRLSVATAQEVELSRVLGGVTPTWSAAGVERLARHIGAGHLNKGWRPRLDDLRGRDGAWSRLLSLYDEAQDCARCARPREAPPRPAPAPLPAPEARVVSAEERRAAAEHARRAKAAGAATTPTPIEEALTHG